MNVTLLKEMKSKLEACIQSGLFNDREIVIFGWNESAERILEYLAEKNLRVNAIVDNNERKIGTLIGAIIVKSPQEILSPYRKGVLILIASRYYAEMAMQLSSLGYCEKTEIIQVINYNSNQSKSLSEEEFQYRLDLVRAGEHTYEEVKKEHSNVEKIFVFPVTLLGDVYLGVAFLEEYLTKQKIEKYVLVMAGENSRKIAKMFGLDNQIFGITTDDMKNLLQYCVFSNMRDGEILVLSHRNPYTCGIGEIGNYKSINFSDQFRYGIFELPEHTRAKDPIKKSREGKIYADCLIKSNGLLGKKKVLLFPNAKTATLLNNQFWFELAMKLKEMGYLVCTNAVGKDESVIEGTIPLSFDIECTIEVFEAVGYVIGLRSGIFDLAATARAKKIILYPDRYYGVGTFYDFFSLRRMGLCNDAIEIICNENLSITKDEIMAEL